MKKALFFIFLCLFLFSGCHGRANSQSLSGQLVRSITVIYDNGSDSFYRFYNTDEKMQNILLYIRSLWPMFQAEEPVSQSLEQTVSITMVCADGSQRQYRQIGEQYFQAGTGAFQKMARGKGARLWRILMENESDPELG